MEGCAFQRGVCHYFCSEGGSHQDVSFSATPQAMHRGTGYLAMVGAGGLHALLVMPLEVETRRC